MELFKINSTFCAKRLVRNDRKKFDKCALQCQHFKKEKIKRGSMNLPEAFITKYTEILGNEAEAFFKSFDEPAVSGFRINPLKKSSEALFSGNEKIPDSQFGYYGKVSGKSAEHVTGLIYSQEPAAQIVGEVAQPKGNMKVLDLCAAPGGKSTHSLSFLGNDGLLVSNEISAKRSKILVENTERFGSRNLLVLNESPTRLAQHFPEYFDMIVLDAPCSGEGMFRKDPNAIQYWNLDYPEQCAQLQKEIITEAMKMLAPGGQLIYSTCTWSPEENEENVSWLLENYPDLSLIDIPKENGLSEGIDMPEVVRCYPHHFAGEGQFVAKLQDNRKNSTQAKKKISAKSNLTREQLQLWEAFAHENLLLEEKNLSGILQVFGDNLYLLPDGLPDLSKLKIARNGLHLGIFKKKRFEPSFALGLTLKQEEVSQSLELTEEEFVKYVAGEVILTEQKLKNGWLQLTVHGNGLGFAKLVNGTVKNYFPKGLRFR